MIKHFCDRCGIEVELNCRMRKVAHVKNLPTLLNIGHDREGLVQATLCDECLTLLSPICPTCGHSVPFEEKESTK